MLDDLEVIRSGFPNWELSRPFGIGRGKISGSRRIRFRSATRRGRLSVLLVMCQDITERKRAEETLLLLNSAVLQSKEAILITDAELDLPGPRIVFVNPAFTKMTGYTAEEVIGKTPRILQGPRTDKTVLSRLRQTLERGEVFEGEAVNYRKDGKEFDSGMANCTHSRCRREQSRTFWASSGTSPSANGSKPNCFNLKKWKPSASWRAASRTSSTAS